MGWLEREEDWLGPHPEPETPPKSPPKPLETTEIEVRVVVWIPILCPYCGSRDNVITGTPSKSPGVRYHHCRACNGRFKSLERGPAEQIPDSGMRK